MTATDYTKLGMGIFVGSLLGLLMAGPWGIPAGIMLGMLLAMSTC